MTRYYIALPLVALATAAPAFGQGGGGGGGGGGNGGGGLATGSGSGGSSVGGTAVNLSGLSGATAGLASIGTTSGGTSSNQVISTTNFLQNSFGNPLYPGRPNTTSITIGTGTGDFGQPSFGTTSGAIGGNGTTSTGGTASVSTGGRTGTSSSSTTTVSRFTGGSLGTSTANISYQAVLKFSTPVVPESQRVSELNAMIARSSMISQPGNYQVLMQNGVVVVRGKAKDDDERRLVEGMIRLEPGVREVRNEIAVP